MCHSDRQRVAGFSLEHYDEITANSRLIDHSDLAASGLLESVVDDYMPPKRAVKAGTVSPLTADEKAALESWIRAGAPNN